MSRFSIGDPQSSIDNFEVLVFMKLTLADWLVVAAYFLINLIIGLYYRKKAKRQHGRFLCVGPRSLLVAGRNLHGGHHVCRGHTPLGDGPSGAAGRGRQLVLVELPAQRHDDRVFLRAHVAKSGNHHRRGTGRVAIRRQARRFPAGISRALLWHPHQLHHSGLGQPGDGENPGDIAQYPQVLGRGDLHGRSRRSIPPSPACGECFGRTWCSSF